jgi:hypothetical protein
METPTPRTDAVTYELFCRFDQGGTYNAESSQTPQGDWAPADFARDLERELITANAQIVVLRESINLNTGWDLNFSPNGKELPMTKPKWVQEALAAPPPPVVPLEDVKPLIYALENIDAQGRPHSGGDTGCGCEQCENYDAVESALRNFTTKYPTP